MSPAERSYWKMFVIGAFIIVYLSFAFLELCVVQVDPNEYASPSFNYGKEYYTISKQLFHNYQDLIMNQKNEIRDLKQKLSEKNKNSVYEPSTYPSPVLPDGWNTKEVYEAFKKVEGHKQEIDRLHTSYQQEIHELGEAHDKVLSKYHRLLNEEREKNNISLVPSEEIVDASSAAQGELVWIYTFSLYINPKPATNLLVIYGSLPEHLEYLPQIAVRKVIVKTGQDAKVELSKYLKEQDIKFKINVAVIDTITKGVVQ